MPPLPLAPALNLFTRYIHTYIRTSSAYLWLTYTATPVLYIQQYGLFGSLMRFSFLVSFFFRGKRGGGVGWKFILFSPHLVRELLIILYNKHQNILTKAKFDQGLKFE